MSEVPNIEPARNDGEPRQYRLAPVSLERAERILRYAQYFSLTLPAALIIPPMIRILLNESAWDLKILGVYFSAALAIYLAIAVPGYFGCRTGRKISRQQGLNYRLTIESGILVIRTEIPVRRLYKFVNVPHCSRIDLSKVSEVKVGHLSGSQHLFMRIKYGWGADLPIQPLVEMEDFIADLTSQVPVKVEFDDNMRVISGLRMAILMFFVVILLTGVVYNYFVWTRHL